MVADVDHFKQINDRYGGDEFVIVLPFTDMEGALFTADRIKEKLSVLPVEIENQVIMVTVSVGVSALVPTRETDRDRLIIEADRALYEAKEMGRERIRCYRTSEVDMRYIDS